MTSLSRRVRAAASTGASTSRSDSEPLVCGSPFRATAAPQAHLTRLLTPAARKRTALSLLGEISLSSAAFSRPARPRPSGERHTLPDTALQHCAMRPHLRQQAQPLDDPMVQLDQLRLANRSISIFTKTPRLSRTLLGAFASSRPSFASRPHFHMLLETATPSFVSRPSGQPPRPGALLTGQAGN
jgi:hypothetical protein